MADEDVDVLAAEYVLGTLTAEERTMAERRATEDSGFAGRIAGWERRLGTLEAMVDPIEPPPETWSRIRERVAEASPEAAIRLPEVLPGPAVREVDTANVATLTRRVRRWRGIAALVGAIAVALLLFGGIARYRPELLPTALRLPAETKVVETVVEKVVERRVEVPTPAPPPPSPGRFVAVLQRNAGVPAFLLTVDIANRTLVARRVSAAPQQGKSYELWLISGSFSEPRSLGVIGADSFTRGDALSSFDTDTIGGATYAVSLEPEGGSPTGTPTGPMLFTGTLVEALPPSPPP